ncbi:hypothetical protein BFINE_55490 [Bacteroides finegoldii DSM 17565]|nr:hypothetical protein BFINE_55490 [Bacteroides finegoldii DSM 17565]
MTGYGKATAELPDKKINVEIKSLNSKAMDLSTRIAPAYREKEIEIRNEISKVLERGKVDFSLWIEKKEGRKALLLSIRLLWRATTNRFWPSRKILIFLFLPTGFRHCSACRT